VRLVRRASGELVVDGSGRMPGRGVYLCRQEECLNRAMQRRAIERSLGASVAIGNRDVMRQRILEVTEGPSREVKEVMREWREFESTS
jgi:predicted RNA-binding protein YlxR (DUF448 family)